MQDLEAAGGEVGVRGWVVDEEEEAEREQQRRQRRRRSQVQEEEAALEGAIGELAGGKAPLEEHRRTCWQQEEVHVEEGAAHGWRRAYSLPPSLGHHSGLNNLVGLAVWRHKPERRQHKQLEAAKGSATEAVQPEAAEEAGLDGKVEAAGAEEVEEENLPPVQRKAWEAESAE